MITRIPCALALVLVFALAACNQGPKHDPVAGWETAYNDKNAEAVAAIYTDDGELLPPGAGAVNGRAAIKDFWTNDIGTQWAKISINATSSTFTGDYAFRTGAWSVESPALTGKYLEVWKRAGDSWQLHRDIWNVDAMPAAPAATPAPQ